VVLGKSLVFGRYIGGVIDRAASCLAGRRLQEAGLGVGRADSIVIACDKREAFAQGSNGSVLSAGPDDGAPRRSIDAFFLPPHVGCFGEFIIGRAFARPVWLA